MKRKLIRKAVPVTSQMNGMIVAYAKRHDITQAEAIRRLVGIALGQDWSNSVMWGGDRYRSKAEPSDDLDK